MYSGIYIGTEKIQSVFLGAEVLYQSMKEYTSANVKTVSGYAREVAYVDMGDYMAVIIDDAVYKLTKTSDSLELLGNPTSSKIYSSYYPSQAWRRGTDEIIIMFTKNIGGSYGFVFAILNTTSWTYTTVSSTLEESTGGAYATGCYDAANDIVYFWKNKKLITWSPATNTMDIGDATTSYEYKMFIDVDGSLKSFKWNESETAKFYNIVNGVETEAFTIDTAEWADEYAGFNLGFTPTDKGLAYQLAENTIIEFNLNDRTVKGYPLSTGPLYYETAWAICAKQGFLAVTAQNSTDIYVMTLQ